MVVHAAGDRSMRPRSGSSAKAMLLTILGECVLTHAGAMWTSTVVGTLEPLGVEERNARQAIARLADQGIVRSVKDGRRARWHLTERGTRLLTEGTKRIYAFGAGADAWDGRWLVVLCSIPEEQRAQRHQLRTQLGFAGFGFVAPGVAISPHLDREPAAKSVLADLALTPGAMVLRAETADVGDAAELLDRAWDLDALEAEYESFITAFQRRSPGSGAECFAALVELVHEWRRFPFVDPEIPPRLLPAGWSGRQAKALFDACHAAWAPTGNAWYEDLDGAG